MHEQNKVLMFSLREHTSTKDTDKWRKPYLAVLSVGSKAQLGCASVSAQHVPMRAAIFVSPRTKAKMAGMFLTIAGMC